MIAILTYQEMLRTLGAFVEIANAGDVGLVVSVEEGALVYGRSWPGPSVWTVADVLEEANGQRSWRDHPRPDRTPRAGPVADCLRAIGAILDADPEGQGPYTLTVAAACVRLQGQGGAESRFEFGPWRVLAPTAAWRGGASEQDRARLPQTCAPCPTPVPARPAEAGAGHPSPVGRASSGALTYEETLRTLGTLFDTTRTREAVIRLSAQGAEVVAGTWRGPALWDHDALRSAAAQQRAQRLVARYARTRRSDESAHYLRLVGAELDRHGRGGEYVLKLQGSHVAVEAPTGETWTFDPSATEQREHPLRLARGQRARRGTSRAPALSPA